MIEPNGFWKYIKVAKDGSLSLKKGTPKKEQADFKKYQESKKRKTTKKK